jgi:hypothetical protein
MPQQWQSASYEQTSVQEVVVVVEASLRSVGVSTNVLFNNESHLLHLQIPRSPPSGRDATRS